MKSSLKLTKRDRRVSELLQKLCLKAQLRIRSPLRHHEDPRACRRTPVIFIRNGPFRGGDGRFLS